MGSGERAHECPARLPDVRTERDQLPLPSQGERRGRAHRGLAGSPDHDYRDWGFGLCFLHLRNVKGYGWNHKRVYRIYRELELNLRIKPRRRIVRERPDPLSVPESINQVWSMDFMHDQLSDGRSFRLSTCWMTSTAKGWVSRSICRCPRPA
jgi:hypothetical protein